MRNRDLVAASLAVVGTTLVWVPLLAPILFSVALLARSNMWRLDYLMPAELFLVALTGGGLLIWAALRSQRHQRMIAWAFGSAVFLLVVGQVLAIVTGLASGAAEPAGWSWALVLASLAGYSLALAFTGIGGLWLIRDLIASG